MTWSAGRRSGGGGGGMNSAGGDGGGGDANWMDFGREDERACSGVGVTESAQQAARDQYSPRGEQQPTQPVGQSQWDSSKPFNGQQLQQPQFDGPVVGSVTVLGSSGQPVNLSPMLLARREKRLAREQQEQQAAQTAQLAKKRPPEVIELLEDSDDDQPPPASYRQPSGGNSSSSPRRDPRRPDYQLPATAGAASPTSPALDLQVASRTTLIYRNDGHENEIAKCLVSYRGQDSDFEVPSELVALDDQRLPMTETLHSRLAMQGLPLMVLDGDSPEDGDQIRTFVRKRLRNKSTSSPRSSREAAQWGEAAGSPRESRKVAICTIKYMKQRAQYKQNDFSDRLRDGEPAQSATLPPPILSARGYASGVNQLSHDAMFYDAVCSQVGCTTCSGQGTS